MKVFARFLSVSAVVALMAGCASNVVYVPKIPPHAQAKLLDYYQQPNNKVFVIAIDPSGDYAFGYDFGKATLKEAAKVAVEKCDANREEHGIIAKPYIYAINDKVVYEEMIMKANQKQKDVSMDAQQDEVANKEAGNPAAE
ncbi:MAG: hypothetical protein K9M54_07580 [Kiritimatiellales bacterium]|nr:hypothetical protein [Kiritimatiellales bacterium]MCF7863782.1 hypothetical protein [Kiritimatiellales bacterium]